LIVEYPKVLSISPRKVLKKKPKGLPPSDENHSASTKGIAMQQRSNVSNRGTTSDIMSGL
jgi:hypothetical protein